MNDNSFRKPNYPTKGIYPGSHLDVSYKIDPQEIEQFNQIIPLNEIDSHMHVTSSTRKGKSEFLKLMFMHHVSKKEGSVVLFDVHGDLSLQCIKMMKGLNVDLEDVIFIDLFLKKGYTPTINPFRIGKVNKETISIVAQELMSAFESIISTDFTDNMEVLLTPLIYVLLMKGDSGIDELVRILDEEGIESFIEYVSKYAIKAHKDFIKNEFNKPKFTKTKEALSLQN